MCDFEALDNSIKTLIDTEATPKRLMAYALDPVIFPDAAYNGFPEFVSNQVAHDADVFNILLRHPYVTRLFWIRVFFENSGGGNFKQVFSRKFDPALGLYDHQNKLNSLTKHLPEPFSTREEFLRNCWLIKGESAGWSSEIWKHVPALVRFICGSTDQESALDKVNEFAECHAAVPDYFNWLIEKNDPDFIQSIIALRDQHGDGWLANIAPLWRKQAIFSTASVAWKLNINGNLIQPVLAIESVYVPDGHSSLIIKQDDTLLEEKIEEGGCRVVSLREMAELRLDRSREVQIYIGRTKIEKLVPFSNIFGGDQPLIFRYSEKCYLLPQVSSSESRPIYAKRLAVLWPKAVTAPQQLYHGEKPVNTTWHATVRMPDESGRLVQVIELSGLAGQEPLPLTWEGNNLLTIGSKPFLEVVSQDDAITWLDQDTVPVVTAGETTVRVKNYAGDPLQWQVDGNPINGEGTEIQISGNPGDLKTISFGAIKTKILFLKTHKNFRERWISENDPVKVSIWAREGLQTGVLTLQDKQFRLSIPLESMVWWWRNGIRGDPELVCQKRDFDDHGELASYSLHVWVPANTNLGISFVQYGTIKPFNRELAQREGPCFYKENVLSLVRNHLLIHRIGDAIDTLRLGSTDVANIFRVPSRPVLVLSNGQPKIFFPLPREGAASTGGFDPAQYTVVCCYESGIKDDKIEIIPCVGLQCGQLNDVPVQHKRVTDEGIWLLLVRSNTLSTSLLKFPLSTPVEGPVLEWFKPGGSTLVQRLCVEGGTEEANQIRGILDALAWPGNVLRRQGVFADAIDGRHLLSYTNRPAFWNCFYPDHCQIEAEQPPCHQGRQRRNAPLSETNPAPLEETLSLMLDAGFNWCAEPNWLIWAFDQIPAAMGWKKLGKKCKEELREKLKEICPLMLVQQAIECGYPACNQTQCPDFGYINYFLNGMPSVMLRLICPQSGYPQWVDGYSVTRPHNMPPITAQGVSLNGNYRSVRINYHASNIVTFARNEEWFRVVLNDKKEQDFTGYMLDGEAIGEEPILDDAAYEKLNTFFRQAIDVAKDILGKKEDRGLGYMLSLASEGFREWDQPGRAVIFQAAVLCRLHAWLGWRVKPGDPAPQYPAGWPLQDADSYGLVCSVVRSAWQDETLRKVFVKDLIPIEWMLAWFHF